MFKENWPLTGLVKLLNPAGGRRLRLIHEQEDCKAVSLCIRMLAWWSPRIPGHQWCAAIWGQLANDSGLQETGCGQTQKGAWMWKAEHQKKWQAGLWHGRETGDRVSPTSSPLIQEAGGGSPTSRCSTSSLVKSMASSLKGSPSCTRPGRFRAPRGHSMPVSGEKENLWWKGQFLEYV